MRSFFVALPLALVLAACASNNGAGTTETPDNDKIDLSISPKGWVTVKTNAGRATGYNQNDSFYGAWVDDSRQVTELSYQGTEATDIPQTGSASYYGNVVRVDSDGDIVNAGTSRLNVDFGKKTVDGYLDLDVARDVTLKTGSLNGAKFAGQATVLGNSGGSYSGTLMGKGATEAAGIVKFENNSSLNAAFGGKRY